MLRSDAQIAVFLLWGAGLPAYGQLSRHQVGVSGSYLVELFPERYYYRVCTFQAGCRYTFGNQQWCEFQLIGQLSGACSLYVNGFAHGPDTDITTCQLHMRKFKDGDTITIELWRSAAFPVIKDLVVDRRAFDKILHSGGYVSVNTGGVPDANAIPIERHKAEESMDAAACIGCGACVATCKNSSAMLFVSARVASLALLPQGRIEAARRAKAMVAKMDELGFGGCTNTRACEAECPKGISIANIARLNREFLGAKLKD